MPRRSGSTTKGRGEHRVQRRRTSTEMRQSEARDAERRANRARVRAGRHTEVLRWRDEDGLTFADIGARLKITRQAAWVAYRNAKASQAQHVIPDTLTYGFPLRPGLITPVTLPLDLSQDEAEQIGQFIHALVRE
jgi:hypothetical protein